MNSLTIISKKHFLACFQMFRNIIPASPLSLWNTGAENTSIWKRVFHTLESVDYWFSDASPYIFHHHFPEMSAEMDHENKKQLSKEELSVYCTLIYEKALSFFNILNDTKLQSASDTHSSVTFLDIILSQIRHIQNNTGYCSQHIKTTIGSGIEWIGVIET